MQRTLPTGFSGTEVFNGNGISNTLRYEEYHRSTDLYMKHPACMPSLMYEFWHDPTVVQRIPLPSEPPYILQQRGGAHV